MRAKFQFRAWHLRRVKGCWVLHGPLALQHFVRRGRTTALSVRILYVPGGGIGETRQVAPAIEAAALKREYVLVVEPARDGGKCVTARKGWGRF